MFRLKCIWRRMSERPSAFPAHSHRFDAQDAIRSVFRPALKLFTVLCCTWMVFLAIRGKAAEAQSALQLKTSDSQLQQAFDWAKAQALAYVSTDHDPVGDWYDAALPGRYSFCMRDVSHQVMGAEALGLAAENKNMLTRFAEGISASKDWASYWEIDREGQPSPADYVSDNDFWYNLPANFDVMSAALRMYMWTGDRIYISSPVFLNFYRHTVTGYIKRWQLQPKDILSRPRIMNRHLASGKFVNSRGIPSYTESRKDFNLGTDLLAAEYRAMRFYAQLLRIQGNAAEVSRFDTEAAGIAQVLEEHGWDRSTMHFYRALKAKGTGVGSGDSLVLYFNAAVDPRQRELSLAELKRQTHEPDPGIEEQSYRPEILFRYNCPDIARQQILDLARPDRKRRSYPEVSYAIIGAITTGMMGVRVVPATPPAIHPVPTLARSVVIQTLPRLPSQTPTAELDGLPIRHNIIDIRQVRDKSSSLTNVSGPKFIWRASFDGSLPFLRVNGRKMRAKKETTEMKTPVTYIDIPVAEGRTVTVAR